MDKLERWASLIDLQITWYNNKRVVARDLDFKRD